MMTDSYKQMTIEIVQMSIEYQNLYLQLVAHSP